MNIFSGYSETAPYTTLAKLESAEHNREVREGTARRHRQKYTLEHLDRVLVLLRDGVGVREVARITGVPKSTVADLKKSLRGSFSADVGR